MVSELALGWGESRAHILKGRSGRKPTHSTPSDRTTINEILTRVLIWTPHRMNPGRRAHAQSVTMMTAEMK